MDTLPQAERYSYVFEGNSQVLDQILASENLLRTLPLEYDPVHVNAEFADQAIRPRSAGREARPSRSADSEVAAESKGAPPLAAARYFANSTARLSRITVTLI